MFEFEYCIVKWYEIHQVAPLCIMKLAKSHITGMSTIVYYTPTLMCAKRM